MHGMFLKMSEENKKDLKKEKKKDPLQEIMDILEEYDKGSPQKQAGFDHWGE